MPTKIVQPDFLKISSLIERLNAIKDTEGDLNICFSLQFLVVEKCKQCGYEEEK